MPPKKEEEPAEEEEDTGPPPVEEGQGVYIFPDGSKYGAARGSVCSAAESLLM